jgi:hypothetical protein
MQVVPINIREHLIPFLFKEFEGIEARYLNRHVKSVKITTNSSLGFMFSMILTKADYPVKPERFNMFISITRVGSKKVYQAKMYKTEFGKNSFLKVDPKHAKDFNQLLEDLFRIAFVYYVDGAVASHPHTRNIVDKTIKIFMTKYELDEYGFTVVGLRRLYHRNKSTGNKINRIQKQPSNRIMSHVRDK